MIQCLKILGDPIMIAIVNTFKQSYKDVREHLPQWTRVFFVPFVVWVISFIFLGIGLYFSGELDFTSEGAAPQNGEGSLTSNLFSLLHYVLNILAMLVLYINGFRYAALGEGGDKWWTLSLDKRLVKMVLYYFLIIILYALYALVAGGITVGSYFLNENFFLAGILGALFVLAGIYLMTRLSLVFLYVAIDQKEALRASWHVMKGNVLRLLGLFVLIGLVVVGFALLGAAILGLGGWLLSLINEWLGVVVFALFIPFLIFVWLVTFALSIKAIALVNKQLIEKK
jgi:hypothetical protein